MAADRGRFGWLRSVRWLITLLLAGSITLAIWKQVRHRFDPLPVAATQVKPLDPVFHRLSPREVVELPVATRFDAPMGSENAAMTYNAQPFRITRHLGDDLNGIGGQNSDLGDPVYSVSAGRVVFARDGGPGWGNMVIVACRVKDETGELKVWQAVYAHLDQMKVRRGQLLQRGDLLGTVGTAGGQYLAHLHFEMREGPYIHSGTGYADVPMNRVSPEQFIRRHRGAPDDQLNPPPRLPLAEVEAEILSR